MTRDLDAPMFALMGRFEHEDDLCDAARAAYEAGYRRMEAYSPFPVDGLAEAIGFRPRFGVNWVIVGGLFAGLTATFALQYYAMVIAYPINVGGRPLNSWPAFVVLSFEVALLVAAITGIVGLFVLNRLPGWRHPVLKSPQFSQAAEDSFFLLIESRDPLFDVENTRRFLKNVDAREVITVAR